MEFLNNQAIGAAYGLDTSPRDTAITNTANHHDISTPMMTQTPTNATARAISAKWVEKHSTRGSVYQHHRGSVCDHSGSSDDSDYDDNYSEEDSSSSSSGSDDSSAYSESDNGQARHASVKLTQSRHRATAVDSPVRRHQPQQQQQQQYTVSAVSDTDAGHVHGRPSSGGSDDNV
jgi:hypothetical protein